MKELYKAVYDYETDKEDELSLKEGEYVHITNKDSQDWWLAERLNNQKQFGLVPSNFLEKVAKEDIKLALVIKDYIAQDPEEISLQKDRIITVLDQQIAEGWWKGDLNGKIGVFPADHVELVSEQQESKKDAFKLAAYGVKQGGIGSILAGGFNLKRTSVNDSSNRSSINDKVTSNRTSVNDKVSSNRTSVNDRSPSTNSNIAVPPPIPNNTTTYRKAMVIHDYNPENEDEIKLMRGEYITVIDQLENDGWWKGESESGIKGIFPSNFVQILEQETPPPRPTRSRPATVKTESSTELARPPPVPVNTRPTSLLTQRESSSNKRPITSPPIPTNRPITSPPIPANRPNSITTSPPTHRRIPSIPLVSPDLPPPVSPIKEKTSRPTSVNNEAILNMAKPPKVNLTKSTELVAPPRAINQEHIPPVPKRSMPKPPPSTEKLVTVEEQEPKDDELVTQVRRLLETEVEKIRKEFESKLEQERQERLKIQLELDQLRASLQ